jgi:hypothetical protein
MSKTDDKIPDENLLYKQKARFKTDPLTLAYRFELIKLDYYIGEDQICFAFEQIHWLEFFGSISPEKSYRSWMLFSHWSVMSFTME